MAILSIDIANKFNVFVEEYLDTYFQKRDFTKIASYLADSFYGCGTGVDEQIFNKEDGLRIFKRDLDTVTTPIKTRYRKKELQILNDTTAIFQASLDTTFSILEEDMKFENLRMTMVLHEVDREIKVVAKHLSLPTDFHEEGESYPMTEVMERKRDKINTISIKF